MPLLVYDYPPFTPNTVIRSAQVNAKFADIQTLLNVTLLDGTNIQPNSLSRANIIAVGTPGFIVVNDSSGKLSEVALLPTGAGGTGLAVTPTSANAGEVFQINGSGATVLAPPPATPGSNIYNLGRFV